jgi:hypothetical protein
MQYTKVEEKLILEWYYTKFTSNGILLVRLRGKHQCGIFLTCIEKADVRYARFIININQSPYLKNYGCGIILLLY